MKRFITRAFRMFSLGCLTGLFLLIWEEFMLRREWQRLVRDSQRQE